MISITLQDEIETLKTKLNTAESGKCGDHLFLPFNVCLYVLCEYVIMCVIYIAMSAFGEDVVGLKATVTELQEQINTKDKTIEVMH